VTAVDWPCELRTLFSTENLGLKHGPARALDWFFEQEPEGIILEDDILPQHTFFRYGDELLERYREDRRVGVISGENPVPKSFSTPYSYFFTRQIRQWGWASWRRVWRLYDIDMDAYPAWRNQGGLRSVFRGQRNFENYWRNLLDATYAGSFETWDLQFFFTCWYHGMLAAFPAQNQTENLGFGPSATTTWIAPSYLKNAVPEPLSFPLRHPPRVEMNSSVDAYIGREVWEFPRWAPVKRLVRRTPYLGDLLKGVQLRMRVFARRMD
jgi:hypothetical protein